MTDKGNGTQDGGGRNAKTPEPSLETVAYYGQSMRRTFRKGDLLRVRLVFPGEIRLGDVVVFSVPEGTSSVREQKTAGGPRYFVHRVVAVCDGSLVTQGDNNSSPDPPVCGEVRKVVDILRNGRRVHVASGRLGMMVFYWHRLRRRLRSFFACILDPVLNLAPLRLFAPWAGKLELARFPGRDIAYWRGRPLAVRIMSNPVAEFPACAESKSHNSGAGGLSGVNSPKTEPKWILSSLHLPDSEPPATDSNSRSSNRNATGAMGRAALLLAGSPYSAWGRLFYSAQILRRIFPPGSCSPESNG